MAADTNYLGPFAPEQLDQLFAAAEPIDTEQFLWEDRDGKRLVSRKEAVVRSLEYLAGVTGLAAERGPPPSHSEIAKRLGVISRIANELLSLLGAEDPFGDPPANSREIYYALCCQANAHAERIVGFA